MTTTAPLSDVRIAELAALLKEILLQPRRVHLKQRADRTARDYQLRRDIACGKALPCEMLLRLQLSDLRDGAPLAAVIRYHESSIVFLRELAGAQPASASEPPLLTIVQRETRAQSQLDEAEQALLVHPDSAAAMDRLLVASAEYDREQDAMVRQVRDRHVRSSVRRALAEVG